MPRIALKIEYLGKLFCGSQFQKSVRTVQSELENALNIFLRTDPEQQIRITFGGRTDSGVHAQGQVAHFDWPGKLTPQTNTTPSEIDLNRLCWGINGILPRDVSVTCAQIVANSFHARFSAKARTYVYRILNQPQRSALRQYTHYFVPNLLDIEKMAEAADYLIGVHDFKAFQSSNSHRTTTTCHVFRAELLNLGEGNLEFWISANHFVYNMVRIIVGTLIEIGIGKCPVSNLPLALTAKQRSLAGPTAPAWGLCLYKLEYPEELNLFTQEACQIRKSKVGDLKP